MSMNPDIILFLALVCFHIVNLREEPSDVKKNNLLIIKYRYSVDLFVKTHPLE